MPGGIGGDGQLSAVQTAWTAVGDITHTATDSADVIWGGGGGGARNKN